VTTEIKLRRDTAANWTSVNPTLASGEVGLETDTRKFKFGDGSTAWTSLTYVGIYAHSGLTGLTADDHTQYTKETERLIVADFSQTGTLTVGTGVFRWYNDFGAALTIKEVRASVGTAPTGAAILIDVNENGTTIFSGGTDRPEIAISGFTDTTTGMSDTSLADGNYLTVDIDQIGSTIAGANLTVQVWMSPA
jgi:hypothetical protein